MIHHAGHALLWALAAGLVVAPFALMILPAVCGFVPDRTTETTRKDQP